jgi:hypothetical protein
MHWFLHWLTTAALIVGLLLAFLTLRELRKYGGSRARYNCCG